VQGNPVASGPGVIGISLDEIRAVGDLIAIAGGSDKVSTVLGAIRGGYVKTPITDTVTARAVLEQHSRRN
jgi:DNA-binding transcriptional regulator LsrR (DeoR family)